LQVGGTPLMPAPVLGAQLGLTRLWLKDDSRNPSASFKDRAGAVALAVAHEQRAPLVAGASTGNAASSFALLCARTGMPAIIFVPENAPAAKVAQILLFGAHVVAVRGTYDQAFDLCAEACREFGWYNRNTGFNPYTREGKKTCSYEIVEQLDWEVPDWVFVSVGDGNILSGLWKGFTDLKALGLISKVPRLAAVQAEGSNAVKQAFDGDGKLRPVSGKTIADSISVSMPRDGEAAVAALRESNGIAISVGDEEILAAMRLAARYEGVFAEPAAAAAVAGTARAVIEGHVGRDESVVTVITGSGLKDVPSAMRAAGSPHLIAPTMKALKDLLRERVRL
jgi:threonine synthase